MLRWVAGSQVRSSTTRGFHPTSQPEQDPLFEAQNRRDAVVFVHPAELPGPAVDGIAPFAADFLLDTTRAAYLLVRNGVRRRFLRTLVKAVNPR
jgi:hypothetical protein